MPEAEPPEPAPSNARSRVRLGLWALALAALVLLGAATPLGATPSDLAAPVQETAGTVTNPCVDDVVQGIGEWDCLPFYRWANEADSFSSNFGATEIGAANVMQPLVTFLYGMAGLMWRLLQWVTRTALAFDLFNRRDGHASTPVALQPIDAGFEAASNIVLSGIGLTVLGLAALVVIARSTRTSETPFRDLARPFLCFAVLLVLLARAAPDGPGGAQAGSPAWVAERGVGMSNLIADQISQVAPESTSDDAPDNLLDCDHYVATLRQSFEEDGDYSEDLVGSVAFQPHLASLMSSLWETAYLDLWIEAQFGGDTDLARRAYCRMLEDRSEISPADQSAIQQAALAAAGASVPAAGRQGTAPFGRFNDSKDFRRGMIAWAVCGWYQDRSGMKEESGGALHDLSGPGFAVNPEFRLMWNLGSPPSEMGEGTCSDWWGTDGSGTTKPDPHGTKWGVRDGDGPFQFGTADDITEAFTVFDEEQIAEAAGSGFTGSVAPYEESDREDLPAARQWVFALNGHNLTRSVPHAILAIVIAAVYLWAIGGLALGTLVAQFLTGPGVRGAAAAARGGDVADGCGRPHLHPLPQDRGGFAVRQGRVRVAPGGPAHDHQRDHPARRADRGVRGGGRRRRRVRGRDAAGGGAAGGDLRHAVGAAGPGHGQRVQPARGAMGVTGRLARGAGAYGPGGAAGRGRGVLRRRGVVPRAAGGPAADPPGPPDGRRRGRRCRRRPRARGGDGAEDGGAADGAGAGGGGPGGTEPGDGVVAGEIGSGSSPRRRGAALLDAVTAGALTAGERGLQAAAPLAGRGVRLLARPHVPRRQVSPRIVPRRHGRAPTPTSWPAWATSKVGGRHARHVETVVAAGNGADPVRSAPAAPRRPHAVGDHRAAGGGRRQVLGVTARACRCTSRRPAGPARRPAARHAVRLPGPAARSEDLMTDPTTPERPVIRPGDLLNVYEFQEIRHEFAAGAGLRPDQVLMTPYGYPPLPRPPVGAPDGTGRLPAGLALEFAGHPVFWLDDATKRQRPDERDDVFAIRLFLELVDRGYLREGDGWLRNPLVAHGFDVRNPADRDRLARYQEGAWDAAAVRPGHPAQPGHRARVDRGGGRPGPRRARGCLRGADHRVSGAGAGRPDRRPGHGAGRRLRSRVRAAGGGGRGAAGRGRLGDEPAAPPGGARRRLPLAAGPHGPDRRRPHGARWSRSTGAPTSTPPGARRRTPTTSA